MTTAAQLIGVRCEKIAAQTKRCVQPFYVCKLKKEREYTVY